MPDIRVENTTVDVGDDCIAIKAGSGERGLREGKPSKKIANPTTAISDTGHGGVVIAARPPAGISGVSVDDCSY
jgi:polygalacturonase